MSISLASSKGKVFICSQWIIIADSWPVFSIKTWHVWRIWVRKTRRQTQAVEGCRALETVRFVDDKPKRSPPSRCQGVPDTERYKRGARGSVCVCQCEPAWMRKTRGDVTRKTQNRQEAEIQQMHTVERGGEKRKEREVGVIKKTFKGVDSRRVTIPGVLSIPPWHSSDKKCLNAADKTGRKEWKEGGQRESAESKERIRTTRKERSSRHSELTWVWCWGRKDA